MVSDRSDWQPIETAPKDGTRILVAFSHNRLDFDVAVWGPNRWDGGEQWLHPACGDPIAEPMAWMRLPEPPEMERP